MPAFLQNDHAKVFQIGGKRFLYPLCRVWITVTVDGYHRACDIRREPQQLSCSSQPGSFRPNALVNLAWIIDEIKTDGIFWNFNGIIGISLMRQVAQT